MTDEKPKEKNFIKRLKQPKTAAAALAASLIIVTLMYFALSNSSCADTTFGYESAAVPAKICIAKNIRYSDGGVEKTAQFGEEFVRTLKITR